jgi:S1-C subfamily serine protease
MSVNSLLLRILGRRAFVSFGLVTFLVSALLATVNLTSRFALKEYVEDQLNRIPWDLAIYQRAGITGRDKLPAIAVGASRDLQVGQKVYAIGNPFGLDQTLTTGIVSALNREIESVTRRTIKGAIQTDAAINPGNSGGPLLDSAGRLIGVNTSIYSPSGASAGIGFAIPVDEVNRIVPRLIRDGRFIRPALGVTAGPENLAKALGVPKGVLLVNVADNSPAAAAGLKPFGRDRVGRIVQGDVITAADGQAVADLDDMLSLLETRQVGEKVTLTVWRAGQTRKVAATLGSSD